MSPVDESQRDFLTVFLLNNCLRRFI